MINPDAKCVVNGSKVNEVIMALNPLLDMEVIVGDVNEPTIKYSEGGIKIIIPSPEGYLNEQLDVVTPSNTAGSRWFLTSTSQGSASSSGASTTTANATPINKSQPSTPNKGRDEMPRVGGGQNNRDKLNTATGGGKGVKVSTGGALRDDGTSAMPLAPSMALRDTGTGAMPIAPSMALRDDGVTARTGGTVGGPATDEFGNVLGSGNLGMPVAPTGDTGADTTPLPGAPPRIAEPPIARSRSGSPAGRSEAMRRANQREARRNKRNTLQTRLMDKATKKRQAEADKMAFANKYG